MKHRAAKILFAALSITSLAAADTNFTWVGGGASNPSGTWSNHNNWDPISADFPNGIIDISPVSNASANIILDVDATAVTTLQMGQLPLGNPGRVTPTVTLQIGSTSLVTDGELLGFAGNIHIHRAKIIQTGGSNTINRPDTGDAESLALGTGTNDIGEYDLSGGSLTVFTAEEIGALGHGTFVQNGGLNQVLPSSFPSNLTVANSAGSTGTYLLNSGTVAVTGQEWIGSGGDGTFIQNGGINTVTNGNLYVGLGGNGVYNQTAGSVTATVLVGDFTTATGAYNLSGGSVSSTFGFFVGGDLFHSGGTGVLNVSANGNLITDGTLTVYNTPGTQVNLSGGSITAAALDFNGNPALFNWTGGTLTITSDTTLSAATASNSTGQVFGSALTIKTGQSLTINGTETLGLNDGSVADGFTLFVGSTDFNSANQIVITPHSALTVSGGTVVAGAILNVGAYAANGATLSVGVVNNFGAFNNTGTLIETGTFTNSAAAYLGGSQSWASGTSFINSGVATFASDAGAGGTNLSVNVTGGSAVFSSTEHLASLAVHNGAGAFIAPATHSVIETAALSFDGSADHWQGLLDLADNDMIVNNGSLTLIKNQIKQGKNGVAGLYSSTAGQSHLLVAIQNDNGSGSPFDTTFDGQTVSVTDVLIKYTFPGDSNLDGNVDVTDLGALATNWQKTGTWIDGDFNDDVSVDVTDLGILASNWQNGVGNPQAQESFQEALESVGLSQSLVPEPEMFASAVAAMIFIRRRR